MVIPDIDRPKEGVGGIVIGGDFQGLGIARSLGRRGAPVCVIDDEPSIARLSRYATHSVRVKDLHDEQKAIDALMDAVRRMNLKGWVVYPTRDETVAALSIHRKELSNGSASQRRTGKPSSGRGINGTLTSWRRIWAFRVRRRGFRKRWTTSGESKRSSRSSSSRPSRNILYTPPK